VLTQIFLPLLKPVSDHFELVSFTNRVQFVLQQEEELRFSLLPVLLQLAFLGEDVLFCFKVEVLEVQVYFHAPEGLAGFALGQRFSLLSEFVAMNAEPLILVLHPSLKVVDVVQVVSHQIFHELHVVCQVLAVAHLVLTLKHFLKLLLKFLKAIWNEVQFLKELR